MRVTEHFLLTEFACKDGEPYPAERRDDAGRTWLEARLMPLCQTLEVVRDQLGADAGEEVALTVTSGYRTPSHNAKVGGAPNSRHVTGEAADFKARTISGREIWSGIVHATVLQLYKDGRLPHLGGLGKYKKWVHIDVRPRGMGGRLKQWTSP